MLLTATNESNSAGTAPPACSKKFLSPSPIGKVQSGTMLVLRSPPFVLDGRRRKRMTASVVFKLCLQALLAKSVNARSGRVLFLTL